MVYLLEGKKTYRFLILFFCFYFYFLPSKATAVNVRIEPAKTREIIPVGSTKSGQVRVVNTSSEPTKVRVYLEDWRYIAPMDGSKEFKPAGTMELSCAPWINFAPGEFTIPAYGSQRVSYSINVPKDATGGHYAVLFFESSLGETTDEEGKRTLTNVRIASLFYIEPAGTIKRENRIENLTLENKEKNLGIKADFKNIGNADIIASGTFDIIDKEGVVYARGKFNDIYTFPTDVAKLSAKSGYSLIKGVYDLVITLQIEGGAVQVIEYQIKIGSQGEVLEAIPQT